MAIKSCDFIELARKCLGYNDEPGYRACISRAYYGMFHETMYSLHCVPSFSSNHHSNLIGYMVNKSENKLEPYDSMNLKILGYSLRQQREARNEADYHIEKITVSKDMAETSLAAADLFFSKWEELKKEKSLKQHL